MARRSPPARPWSSFRWICFASDSLDVIPGWSEGPDPESRDSGFDASRPGMTGIFRFRNPPKHPENGPFRLTFGRDGLETAAFPDRLGRRAKSHFATLGSSIRFGREPRPFNATAGLSHEGP